MSTDSLDFDVHLDGNTRRFLLVVSNAVAADVGVLDRAVPSCPDWRLADLVWHLAEVQDFWSFILSNEGADPSTYDRATRPDDALLVDFLAARLKRLQVSLQRPDSDSCWSWSPSGGTVAWVRRRQAQEALIHRVDAELTVNNRSSVDEELAADGIDELMQVMLGADALPNWATFTAAPGLVTLDSDAKQWTVEICHVKGTSPEGTELDDRAVRLVNPEPDLIDDQTHTVVSGSSAQLLLWLWGRTERTNLTTSGNANRADDLRSIAAEVTGG